MDLDERKIHVMSKLIESTFTIQHGEREDWLEPNSKLSRSYRY